MKRSYFNTKQTSGHNPEISSSFEMNEFLDMNIEEFDDEKDENKRKNRNLSEKKRRDQFNFLINELCSIINYNTLSNMDTDSVSFGNKQKTDKSSILRASIAFLKIHSEVLNKSNEKESNEQKAYESDTNAESNSIFSWKPSFLVNDEFIHLMLEALDSFLIIIEANSEGKIVYVSETFYPLLGLMPMQLTQKFQNNREDNIEITIYDLIHNEERSFVENFLIPKQVGTGYDNFASILLHFKDHDFDCETESYQLVRLIGSFYDLNDLRPNLMYGQTEQKCFVGIGRLQTPKFLRELTINVSTNENEFVSRNSLEWKFLYLDHRASPIIGYLPFEILGTSGYDYYHWNDLDDIVAGHEQLMRTGEGTSCVHRFLTKSQQWIWLRTNYYIAYHQWNSKPEFIVCTHNVVNESDLSYVKNRKMTDQMVHNFQENRTISNDNYNNSSVYSSIESTSAEPRSATTSMSSMWSSNRDSDPSGSDPSVDYMNPTPGHSMSGMCSSSGQSNSMTNVNDMSVQSDSVMTSPKKHSILHEFLQQKTSLLEHQIKQQQEELRRVTEQLVLVKAVNNE